MDDRYILDHHPKLERRGAVQKVLRSSTEPYELFLRLRATGKHPLTSVSPSVADLCEALHPHIHATGHHLDLLSRILMMR